MIYLKKKDKIGRETHYLLLNVDSLLKKCIGTMQYNNFIYFPEKGILQFC